MYHNKRDSFAKFRLRIVIHSVFGKDLSMNTYVSSLQPIDYTIYKGRKTRDFSQWSLQKAINKYMEERNVSCSPSTLARYDEYQRLYFCDMADIRLCDFNDDVLQAKIDQMSVNYAPKTVKNAYVFLHSVLEEFLPNHFWKVQLPPMKESDYYIPITADVEELISVVDNKLLVPVLLAAYGGLRRSEVCGLRKSDFTRDGVHIRRAVVYDKNKKPVIKPPKTKAGYRFVPLSKKVVFMATRWNDFGVLPNTLTRRYTRAIKKSGLPYFSFHKLRHYFASKLHAEGIPDQYICKVGGWKPETLQKIYQHTLSDIEKTMNNTIASIFD